MRALDSLLRLCFANELTDQDRYLMLGYNASVPPYVRQALLSRSLDNDDLLPKIRKPTAEDQSALDDLIARSARELSAHDYSPQQIQAALRGAFGVDTQLIGDETYFVVEAEGQIVGCGGWSRRRTLFGGDTHAERDAAELDPRQDAAKIRAFFVDPAHARRGIGGPWTHH